MEKSVKERLKDYLLKSKIREIDFCNTIGVSAGYISGMRKSMQPDKLKSIAINYPNLNIGWLLTGKGEMELSNENVDYIPDYNYDVLQHYTPPDGLIGILREMKLNFSKQGSSNDIKERRLLFHREVENTPIDKKKKKKEFVAKYKWISFFVKDEKREVRQPKMYDLYAEYHKGGCIEFNKAKLKALNSHLDIEFCEVKYTSSFRASEEKETVRNELEYKYYQWRDEKEYRIIYHGDEKCIKINDDCIERIYLGSDFFKDEINVAEFCDILKKHEISIEKVSEVNVIGIGYLHAVFDKHSPGITKMWNHIPNLIPYLSKEYREKYNIDAKIEQKKIDYIEEKYYRKKYYSLLERADNLITENNELNKKYTKSLEEKDALHKEAHRLNEEIKKALRLAYSLQNKIASLKDELGEVKNDLVKRVAGVITALTGTGT
jgi:transcriptional regulator with XRE-family HTH domain